MIIIKINKLLKQLSKVQIICIKKLQVRIEYKKELVFMYGIWGKVLLEI